MNYPALLQDVKNRIRQAQLKASMSANTEMILMYWDVGRIVATRQTEEGWGASIIPRLSRDLRNDLPEIKGFSERNIDRMLAFYREYRELPISPPPVAKLPLSESSPFSPLAVAKIQEKQSGIMTLLLHLPWTHNVLLLRVSSRQARLWYAEQTLTQGWSKDHLEQQIRTNAYSRQGTAITNFEVQLPMPQSALAQETIKNPYVFDFMTLEKPFHERELETGLIAHLEKFLLELGAGFAFVGRQYHLEVSEQDFYIDLLFYHLKLRCYVVIELKKGKFKPEYAGKMNFYCSVVDDQLRHEQDNPTIGLILCQANDKIIAEYALKDVNKPIGISEYELTRALPDNLKSSLPTVEEIEERLEEKP